VKNLSRLLRFHNEKWVLVCRPASIVTLIEQQVIRNSYNVALLIQTPVFTRVLISPVLDDVVESLKRD